MLLKRTACDLAADVLLLIAIQAAMPEPAGA